MSQNLSSSSAPAASGFPVPDTSSPPPAARSLDPVEIERLLPNGTQEERDLWWRQNVYRADKEPQLSLRAILVGIVIGAPCALVSLHLLLTVNQGFSVGTVAMLGCFVLFNFLNRVSGGRISRMGLLETTATSSVAYMSGYLTGATVVAAFGSLLLFTKEQTPWYIMAPTVFFAGLLGTLIAIPFKRPIVNEEQLRFPSAISGAVMMRGLYADQGEAMRRAYSMFAAMGLSAAYGIVQAMPDVMGAVVTRFASLRAGICGRLAELYAWPALIPLSNPMALWGMPAAQLPAIGLSSSSLFLAIGMIVGLRVSLTMLVTTLLLHYVLIPSVVSWDIAQHGGVLDTTLAPAWQVESKVVVVDGVAHTEFFVVKWALWSGAVLIVVSSLVAMAFRWKTLLKAFGGIFATRKAHHEGLADPIADLEVPGSWSVAGLAFAGTGMTLTLMLGFGLPWWLAALGVLLSCFLSLICVRAAGETDWTPLGAMGKVMQVLYAVMPGSSAKSVEVGMAAQGVDVAGATVAAGKMNLAGASLAVTTADACTGLMYDLKTGYLLGQNARQQLWGQLIGLCVGTLVTVPCWYLLVHDYETFNAAIESHKFNPVASITWNAVAELLVSKGFDTLPRTVVASMIVAAVLGVLLPVFERIFPRKAAYMPSAMGAGLAMVLPFNLSMGLGLGAILMHLWRKLHPKSAEDYGIMVACGAITGEALVMAFTGLGVAALNYK